jgi:hypothetical protein
MKLHRVRVVLVGLGLLLAMGLTASRVEALSIPFSQSAGFEAFSATLQTSTGGAPVAGRGGLEFVGEVTAPPGAPVGDGSVPPDIWSTIGWGCGASCPPGGISAPADSDPFANPSRSALRITGFSGFLTDLDWSDITLIEHKNQPITGNVLQTVSIESIFRLGSDPFAVEVFDSVLLNFRETPNSTCSVAPLPGAPVNPLGSRCDDFVIVQFLDLGSLALGGGVFVDFRLDARDGALVCTGVPGVDPIACGGYTGESIIIYTAENDINALVVQGRLRLEQVAIVPGAPALVLLGLGLGGLTLVQAALRGRRTG